MILGRNLSYNGWTLCKWHKDVHIFFILGNQKFSRWYNLLFFCWVVKECEENSTTKSIFMGASHRLSLTLKRKRVQWPTLLIIRFEPWTIRDKKLGVRSLEGHMHWYSSIISWHETKVVEFTTRISFHFMVVSIGALNLEISTYRSALT